MCATRRPLFYVREDDLTSQPTRELLTLHLSVMNANSPPGQVFALDLSALMAPEVTVWSAWAGSLIAAIGALKMLGARAAEIKSMRTHPDFLRQGAAAAILERIVGTARARGVRRLSLETGSGPAFEPAITLYRRYGFTEGAAFGGYIQSSFNQSLHLTL